MIKAALLFCLVFLSACSATNSSRPFIPRPVDAGTAAIYIYRPPAVANAVYSPDLYVNGELKQSVKNGKNSRLVLPAGDYQFEIDADNNSSSLTGLSLKLKPEATYYIRITTSLKIRSATDYAPYQRSFDMELIDAQQAVSEITQCCMRNTKEILTEVKAPPVGETTDDGFSVDKTQNPFSH